MKPTLLPIHLLLAHERVPTLPVCHAPATTRAWADFAAAVRNCAGWLQAQPASRWLLCSSSADTFAIWLLALLHAGKNVVIPPNMQAGTLEQLGAAFDAVAGDELPQAESSSTMAAFDPYTAHITLYTSGSTGSPKAVHKTMAQFESEIGVLESVWGASLGQLPILATVPHHHIYGLLFRLLWPLAAGRPFDTVQCAHPDTLQQRIAALGEHVLVASPAQLTRLPELLNLSHLRPAPQQIFSSGGPLPAATADHIAATLGQAPIEVFGSTETGGIAWRQQGADDAWTLLPGIRIETDADSTHLFSPFLGSEKSRTLDDAVAFVENGRFRLLGRRDRVLKIEEKRISLHALETHLSEHPWVQTAAAVGLGGRRDSIGVAVVLNAAGLAAQAEGGRLLLRRQLRMHLARYYEPVLLPRYWRYPAQLPFNTQGKLTQAALTELFDLAHDAVPA